MMRNLLIKTLLIVFAVTFPNIGRTDDNLGVPSYFWVNAYSIEDYPPGIGDLGYSHEEADSFYHELAGEIEAWYPQVYTKLNRWRKDSEVTSNNFLSDYQWEAVYFSGHGETGGIELYDTTQYLYQIDNLTRYTKWIFFDSCLTLNDSSSYINSTIFSNGLHAAFGFKSLSIQARKRDFSFWCLCWKTTNATYWKWDDFAEYWIEDGQRMDISWLFAVENRIYDAFNYGVQPIVYYPYCRVETASGESYYYGGGIERFEEVYDGTNPCDTWPGRTLPAGWSTSYNNFLYTTVVYGTPEYE